MRLRYRRRGSRLADRAGHLRTETELTLELVLQAVDRSTVCDEVWLAVRGSTRGRGRKSDPRVKRLCRLLGFGLLCVSHSGRVDALVEPVAWRPRPNAKRRSKILEEHRRRKGDPTTGGAARRPIMTAYRQQALECAAALARAPARPRDLKPLAPDAPKILRRNVYGWFIKPERGVYALSDAGRAALFHGRRIFLANTPMCAANRKKYPRECKGRAPTLVWRRS